MSAKKQCRVCNINQDASQFATSTVCCECIENYRLTQEGWSASVLAREAFARDHKRQRRIQIYQARAKRKLPLFAA